MWTSKTKARPMDRAVQGTGEQEPLPFLTFKLAAITLSQSYHFPNRGLSLSHSTQLTVRSEMSSPPVGAYPITAYPSENPIRPVILLNYTFFSFFPGGGKDKTQRGAPWQRRGVGGGI